MTNSKIAWTDHTFNPWIGCTKVSVGCMNCYAERMSVGRMGLNVWGADKSRKRTVESTWKNPLKWNRDALKSGNRAKVFCGSMCDVFEDNRDACAWRHDLWDLIQSCMSLDWLLLTKRPEHILSQLPTLWGEELPNVLPNVWLGTTVESCEYAHRIDILRSIPAAKRFISYEPAIGPFGDQDLTGIDWLIYGGESGDGFRRHDIQWARDVRKLCQKYGTAFFYKQSPGLRPGRGATLDGEIIQEFPDGAHPCEG